MPEACAHIVGGNNRGFSIHNFIELLRKVVVGKNEEREHQESNYASDEQESVDKSFIQFPLLAVPKPVFTQFTNQEVQRSSY